MIARLLRAYPTLLKIGFSEVIAYRAEFLVWVLTTTMPLVNLALWSAVSSYGPVGRFGQKDFIAYFLATLVVRQITSSWVAWEMTMDIRRGAMATRLLRPLHPLLAYSAEHLAAVPLRILVSVPIIAVLVYAAGDRLAIRDPVLVGIIVASLAGAWLLMFLTMVFIGALAMFVDSAIAVFELWFGIYSLFSGYFVPIELFSKWWGTAWIPAAAHYLPFRFMLGFPVETLIGLNTRANALRELGIQWAFVAVLFAGTTLLWRAGMKRFVAFGA